MRARTAFLPSVLLGLVAAGASDCGGASFEAFDASSDAVEQGSGRDSDASGSSGHGNSGTSAGGASGGASGDSHGAGSSSGAGSNSGGSTGTGSGATSGAGGGSGHGSGASAGLSGSASGSSGTGASGSGASGSSSGGGSGAGSGSPTCLSGGGCDAGTVCCGTSCCTSNQLCCTLSGPVPPVDPYYCYTPTASQPTCPAGCAPKCVSDRNVKRDIEPADEQAVLAGLSHLPISTWSYTCDDPSVRHLGPMAQDFYARFGLGDSDRQYDPIDAHGVAFAAIKALSDQLQRHNERIERLERENRELRQGLSR